MKTTGGNTLRSFIHCTNKLYFPAKTASTVERFKHSIYKTKYKTCQVTKENVGIRRKHCYHTEVKVGLLD